MHLAREEAQLLVTLDLLERIHSALLRSDRKELTAVLEERSRAEVGANQVREAREQLLGQLATNLGLSPEGLTLRRLADALSPTGRAELSLASERLRTLFDQVDKLARSNTALAAYGIGFIRRYLSDLTGSGMPAGRYGANGTHLDVSLRPLFSGRG
jgi:hypothetical protein